MNTRDPGIALALGALLAILGAGEARAAAVCSNTPGPNDWIRCSQTGAADIDVDLTNPAISTTGPADEGIEATHTGTGDIDIDVTGGSIAAADANGVDARHEAAGAIDIDMTNVDVSTQGQLDYGVYAGHQGTSGTGIDIDVTGGSVTTAGSSAYGISASVNDATGVAVGMAVSIDTKNTRVSTMGDRGYGVFGWINTVGSTAPVSVVVAGGSVTTAGLNAHAVRAYTFSQTSTGAITVGVTDRAAVSTTGRNAHGVLITQNGLAGIDADLTDAVISTANTSSYGFMGWLSNISGSQLLDIDILRGSVKTTGARSYGILGYVDRAASASAISIDADGVVVSTTGYRSYGFFALSLGTGRLDVDLEDVAISTTGDESYGVVGNIRNAASTAAIAIDAAGDRAIAVEGLNAAGLLGLQAGLGSVGVTTGAETSIEAPFAVGMEARATNDASAAGRLAVTHGGAVEAREVGVLAWAARSSGHTMGAGARTADDAARTEPMVHVTSSGDVTVGASVADAFIRSRIAGADETLSAAEQAVLDAVTAEDSDALDTALAALPAAYDDDWKAEARNLLRKRIDEPDAAGAANRAAEKILGLSRAGVRAAALSHTGMATFIRQGDRDPAILAIAAASRTEQQQMALAEQEKLSAAERTVLKAALTGSGLETALAALTGAAYTDDWKDGVRERAASYNAGDVRVDVTGGSIAAEGNGVEALYAVPHDSNGAISVTVAGGARVTGGANGLYVRGAGAGEGGLRAQSVTVNGRVMGGTGAGVHMADGGRLTVGKTGRVGATSGVGVLSDGAGGLHATVAGTVEGDVQAQGGGALTLNVMEGGAVTGTAHDPAGPLTVAGSIGRLLYTSGGTVTVASTGRLTGVEVDGATEALRSDGGDLSMTVAGMVTGDVLGLGDDGDHMVTVARGGTVTGTIRLAASAVRVDGAVGRVRFDDGGGVTVGRTGRITGIEGVAIRNAGGVFRMTSAGRIEGNIDDDGERPAAVTVEAGGRVEGSIDLSAEGSEVTVDGAVGRVRLHGGGAVTVGGTGRITGIERQAVTSAQGDLGVEIRQAPGETAEQVVGRIPGAIQDADDAPEVRFVFADGRRFDLSEPGRSVPVGACDLVVERVAGGIRFVSDCASRSVYEVLPSVLLGMNGPTEWRARAEAPRSSNGAWARVEASGGAGGTKRSTSASGSGIAWSHRSWGVEAGVDFPLEAGSAAGVSMHRRRGSAKVSGNDGRIEVSGAGLGASVSWRLSDGVYVDGGVTATWYDVALKSGRRGSLKSGVGGFGHAVALEAGRRVALGPALTLTPRARVVHSRVDVDDFTDAAGVRVSLDRGRAVTGVAGVALEASEGRGRVFGSVDVEHAFSTGTRVTVSDAALSSKAEATRVRFEVGGAVEWAGGRYALQGAARWAAGARDYGGGLTLKARF